MYVRMYVFIKFFLFFRPTLTTEGSLGNDRELSKAREEIPTSLIDLKDLNY